MSVSCFFIQHHARKNLLLFSHFWYNCMYKNQGAPPHLILPMIPLLSICIKICETLFLVSVRQQMFLVFQPGQQTLARRKQRKICFQPNREWMKTQTNAGQCALCFFPMATVSVEVLQSILACPPEYLRRRNWASQHWLKASAACPSSNRLWRSKAGTCVDASGQILAMHSSNSVSYTHLTLPTIYSV